MNNENAIKIGKVISTHGINGWLAIHSYSHPSENIKDYNTFLIMEDKIKSIKILKLKVMPKKIIVQLEDYDDINISQRLIGENIYINATKYQALIRESIIGETLRAWLLIQRMIYSSDL